MNSTSTTVAVISIVVVLLVAAGVLLHPESPLTIIYLFPVDFYYSVVRIFYPRYRPGPGPRPNPAPQPNPPNGYRPDLPPRFPVNPSPSPNNFVPENNGFKPGLEPHFPTSGSIPASYSPSATNFLPVNPNNNVTPYSPPLDPTRSAFKAIEPSHAKDLHPYMLL